jgi:hypothetical protein
MSGVTTLDDALQDCTRPGLFQIGTGTGGGRAQALRREKTVYGIVDRILSAAYRGVIS